MSGDEDMNYFEIKPDGQAYIRTDSGTIIRKVGSGEAVNQADFNKDESLFVITYNSGKCEIRDRKNNVVREIAAEGVEEAFWRHEKVKSRIVKEYILLVMKNGEKQTLNLE